MNCSYRTSGGINFNPLPQVPFGNLNPFIGPPLPFRYRFKIGFGQSQSYPVSGFQASLKTIGNKLLPGTSTIKADWQKCCWDPGQSYNAWAVCKFPCPPCPLMLSFGILHSCTALFLLFSNPFGPNPTDSYFCHFLTLICTFFHYYLLIA